jgi:hypothetical protein
MALRHFTWRIAVSVTVHDCQKAFLLLQLLGQENKRLMRSEANEALRWAANRKSLALDVRAANSLRDELTSAGYMRKQRARTPRGGMADYYELTERGLALLLELPQYPGPIVVPGRAINELLLAGRQAQTAWQAPPASSDRDLARLIVEQFESLRRERYSHTGLVPIPVLRSSVADACGPEAANHEILDPLIRRLWREGRLQMVPISDLRDATAEELADAIPGVNETLFYLEMPREQPLVH